MGLFNHLDKPIFLKEQSDAVEFISKLNSLLPKASGDVKERIEKELKLTSIGEFGEQNIIFELKNSNMPMYILHDIHLQHEDLSAQIDFIVVTRIFIYIIECKNLIGDIEIDSNSNFMRSYEYKGKRIKEGIYSPITQNQRHLNVIKQIRKDNKTNVFMRLLADKMFDITYKSLVVLANPKTILNARYAKNETKQQVIRADQLIKYIKETNNLSKQPAMNDNDMKDFAESLLNMHTPNQTDYSKKYEEIIGCIDETSVKTVVNHPVELEIKLEEVINNKEKAEINFSDNTETLAKNFKDTDKLVKNLKAFRLERSRTENIKPYFIFNDNQMFDLLDKMPSNKMDLKSVSGFGEAKVNKYGDEILQILKEHK